MERQELRLECLRLAVSRTVDHVDGLTRAEAYFEFVNKQDLSGSEKQPTGVQPISKKSASKAGNISSLE